MSLRWARFNRRLAWLGLAPMVFWACLNLALYWLHGHHWFSLAAGLLSVLLMSVQLYSIRTATRRLHNLLDRIEYDWRELE